MTGSRLFVTKKIIVILLKVEILTDFYKSYDLACCVFYQFIQKLSIKNTSSHDDNM